MIISRHFSFGIQTDSSDAMTDNESASAGNTEGANEPNSSVKTSKRAKEQADADRKLKELTQRFAQAGPNPDAATIRTVSEYVASALGMEVDSARELTGSCFIHERPRKLSNAN